MYSYSLNNNYCNYFYSLLLDVIELIYLVVSLLSVSHIINKSLSLLLLLCLFNLIINRSLSFNKYVNSILLDFNLDYIY